MWVVVSAAFMLGIGLLFYFAPLVSGKAGTPVVESLRPSRPRRQHLAAGGVVFLFAPLVIFLHELGHWSAGTLMGFDLILLHDRVLMPPQTGLENTPDGILWFTVCGPLVELSLSTVGCILLWKYRRSCSADDRLFRYWLATLCAICGLRWLRFDFDGKSDERSISELLAMPPSTVSALMILPALFALWLIIDVHRRQKTERALLFAFATAVVSALVYLNVLGPLLFPTGLKVEP